MYVMLANVFLDIPIKKFNYLIILINILKCILKSCL